MKGGSVEKAAGELSIDSFTKARGGDIPEFSREMRPDLFDAASRAKKPGEIIGPFRSQDGIHVIRFIKKIPAEERKFEDVKENLKGRIIAQKRQAAYSEFLRNLRETAGVRLDNSFIEDGAKAARPQPAQGGSQPAPPKGR
jgi:parvulin-like peptidyl-prolyl isomerase